jgi:transposase-like protein
MIFKGRHFDRSVILLCVRWYLAYGLSLRNLEEMMAERGISVDHASIHRWTVHYASLLLAQFNRRKRPATGRWHVDETYITVSGGISGDVTLTEYSRWSARRGQLLHSPSR